MNLSRRWTPWLLAFVLAGCSPTASVTSHVPPPPHTPLPDIRADNLRAARLMKNQPLGALASSLDAARLLETRLIAGDRSTETMNAYNFAVARVVEAIDKADLDPWSSAISIPSADGNFHLRSTLARNEPRIHPSNYRMIPTDQFSIGGIYFEHKEMDAGVGAPIAMIWKRKDRSLKKNLDETTVYGTATATLSFHGNNAELQIHESLRVDTVQLGGKTFPLAADFSTPLALLLVNQKVEKLGLVRLIAPDRYADTARLTRLQLYDPERIPLLLVHGLDSTPATWTPMINELRADPDIRKRYQIWVFSYPTGYPYPHSAELLRRELDSIDKRFPDHKPIVLVGHSMGGIISRLMLTDSGDSIWKSYFGKSPAETKIPGRFREPLEKSLIFEHRRDIGRAIFISAPHQGSQIAISSFGRLMSRLVRVPAFLADTRKAVISVVTLDATALNLARAPSSIDTMAPNNRFVRAVAKLPLTKAIPFHSIIGDRGKGNTPHSSDGAVPYWSSHLDGAVSEKIVPSGHSAHQSPAGIAEVRRILRMNAMLPPISPE